MRQIFFPNKHVYVTIVLLGKPIGLFPILALLALKLNPIRFDLQNDDHNDITGWF